MPVRYYDVGMNLCDLMFRGSYHGRQRHVPDLESVLKRAKEYHVDRMLLTGSSLVDSRWSIDKARELCDTAVYPRMTCTVGVHPCAALEFEKDGESPEVHIDQLRQLIVENADLVRAVGEIGLDYDRLHFAPAAIQKTYFELQLKLACEFDLPLFLHMRNACEDFLSILLPFVEGTRADGLRLRNPNCLIHSFSGTKQDLEQILACKSFWVSVNGVSFRTEENCEVAAQIPLERLLIETDSPWCEIKRTHACYKYLTKAPSAFYPVEYDAQPTDRNTPGTVHPFLPLPVVKPEKYAVFTEATGESPLIKARNEPCMIGLVAEVMAKLKGVSAEEVIERSYMNSEEVFDGCERGSCERSEQLTSDKPISKA